MSARTIARAKPRPVGFRQPSAALLEPLEPAHDEDLYGALAALCGITRDEAKRRALMRCYS